MLSNLSSNEALETTLTSHRPRVLLIQCLCQFSSKYQWMLQSFRICPCCTQLIL